MADFTPIPISLKQRVQIFRIKVLPVLVFLMAVAGVFHLWNHEAAPVGLIGEVHGVSSEIIAPVAGTFEGTTLKPFSRVEVGDLIGYLRTVPIEQLEASVAVLQAEIELTRLGGFDPVIDQQRNVLSWLGLYQDFLAARAELASLRIKREQAEREYKRYETLQSKQHISAAEVDRLRAEFETLAAEEEGMAEQVEALERAHHTTDLSASGGMTSLPESIRAALVWQEKRLEQLEAELAPIPLRAPSAGVVVRLLRTPGEFVVAGTVIATVRSEHPEYIIGYLSPPLVMDPQPGMEVEIISRGNRSLRGRSVIEEVGTEFEPLGPIFYGPFSALEERGLPLKIPLPGDLRIRPGELVDLHLLAPRAR